MFCFSIFHARESHCTNVYSATLLLAHARTQTVNQKRLESFLAASSSPNFDLTDHFMDSPTSREQRRYRSPVKGGTSGANTPRDLNARVKILELYTLHVLLRNNEWEYAREFISVSSVLDEERREAFLQALQSLQEEQQEADRIEMEERQRQEDQLRRDIEEAKRLRAENEEFERRRIEEERLRREGSEVDYGIDPSGSSTSSFSGRSARQQPGNSKWVGAPGTSASRAPPTRPRAKSTQALTLAARATMVVNRFKLLLEHLTATFRTNPMVLMRLVAFIASIVLLFSQKNMRERIQRILGNSWNKVKATAGMGVKVSYI
jgi:hypothetical protein